MFTCKSCALAKSAIHPLIVNGKSATQPDSCRYTRQLALLGAFKCVRFVAASGNPGWPGRVTGIAVVEEVRSGIPHLRAITFPGISLCWLAIPQVNMDFPSALRPVRSAFSQSIMANHATPRPAHHISPASNAQLIIAAASRRHSAVKLPPCRRNSR